MREAAGKLAQRERDEVPGGHQIWVDDAVVGFLARAACGRHLGVTRRLSRLYVVDAERIRCHGLGRLLKVSQIEKI